MFGVIFKAIFGTKGERDLKKMQPIVDRINSLESEIKSLSDQELSAKTDYFKKRIKDEMGADPSEISLDVEGNAGNKNKLKDILDSLLPEAFAVVREAAFRTIKLRPYDVQLIGGIVLHNGIIAEMKTGEGKTLAATMPVYLNALAGRGVHLVTVNDYLAERDAEWMGPIYRMLGLTVGWIINDISPEDRQKAYACDVTYGTNNEFGFDYLRDNMVEAIELKVQKNFYFCIVDEVDSILIDEARTPLIISGPSEDSTKKYHEIQKVIPRLKRGYTVKQDLDTKLNEQTNARAEITTLMEKTDSADKADLQKKLDDIKSTIKNLNREKHNAAVNKKLNDPLEEGDYVLDESDRSAFLTPNGIKLVESILRLDNLYSNKNIELVHHIEQALKANTLFKRDVDYVVKEGQIMIVDEFTGRLMHGRRYSDGLHQALEAKERVHVERENQTLATITFQNYFRMYTKLSGMTGTADTEAEEFHKIYKLDVAVIPTNEPIIRKDSPDKIFRTVGEKFKAIADEIEDLYSKGQPMLVGTVSVENSEKLSRLLKNRHVPHNVLNAKFHDREAEIIAQAGALKRVTIATNMAGRGTDIVLGGNPEMQSRIMVENLLKGKLNKSDVNSETIGDFVRLITRNKDEELKAFVAEYPVFDSDVISKVNTICEQCKADQEKVLAAGGLHILGTERHEARRIDNQLRGRGGRQGDPGSSVFYLSLEDDLMRLFGGERLINIMQRLGMKEGEQIEHPLISRAIANAQKRVESRNFEIRKHLLKYDEVMNEQRTYIYGRRNEILESQSIKDSIHQMIGDVIEDKVTEFSDGRKSFTEDGLENMKKWIDNDLKVELDLSELGDIADLDFNGFKENLEKGLISVYNEREKMVGSENMRALEKYIMLNIIDNKWKEHLLEMDYMQEGINWRAYAEKDPLVEYKFEGFKMFKQMMMNIDHEALSFLYHAELTGPIEEDLSFANYYEGNAIHDEYDSFDLLSPQEKQMMIEQEEQMAASGGSGRRMKGRGRGGHAPRTQVRHEKVGRNEPCPCGSGKKYKHCCYPKYE